jgi:hypothetical protein
LFIGSAPSAQCASLASFTSIRVSARLCKTFSAARDSDKGHKASKYNVFVVHTCMPELATQNYATYPIMPGALASIMHGQTWRDNGHLQGLMPVIKIVDGVRELVIGLLFTWAPAGTRSSRPQ